MEKKGNRHRKHKRNFRTAVIITMAGVAVIVGEFAMTPDSVRDKYAQRNDYMKREVDIEEGVVYNEEDTSVTDNNNEAENQDDVHKEELLTAEEETVNQENEEITSRVTLETTGNIVDEKTSEEVVTTTKVPETTKISYKKLNVKCILQNPELPTGCEITALTTILNYLGYNVNKLTMADNYLEKGEIGEVSPYKAFVGNPRNEDSCGAFAPVLVNSARKYLAEKGSDMNVYNVTGADYSELVEYVNEGHPVMVWETMWMAKPHDVCTWYVDGENITWRSHEHAMVLIGYTEDTYIMADPLRGIYEYDKELTEARYRDMGQQAIVIY